MEQCWDIEHAFNIASVNFDNEVANTYEVNVKQAERTIKTINLQLHLRELGFAIIESDRAKAIVMSNTGIFNIALAKMITNGGPRSVDSKDYWGRGVVVNGTNGRGLKESVLEIFLSSKLV